MILNDKILKLTKALYPNGRAFTMPVGGFLETLHKALINTEAQAYTDALSILNNILPDNANFTIDDATDWERRLGLVYSPLATLAARMQNIKNKMNYPGKYPAMGSYLYLQQQLRAAGFNVYVYENNFGGLTMTPEQLTGLNTFQNKWQFNDRQFGQVNFGGCYNNLIANSITQAGDLGFKFGSLRNTFFVGGSPAGQIASIPASQQAQFRQLILQTKQVQTVGFLLINYT
jgi:uncharacterized protein YmfQ (DUF2313 family)